MIQNYLLKNSVYQLLISKISHVCFFSSANVRNHINSSSNGFLLVITLFASQFIFSQVTIPSANTNTGSVNDPFGTFWGYERAALIYSPTEIGTTGTINKIGFYLNSVSSPGAATNVRIYMKMRNTLMTANSTYATETTGATLVYGPTTIAAGSFVAGGWVNISLATTFSYTGGTDNLEVIIETNATGTGNEGSSGKQCRYSTASSSEYYQYWNADTTAPTGNGTRSTTRPNIQLHFVPTITSLGATSGCVGSSITVNGTNLTGATASNVQIGGTGVTSITSNSGTALVAVIGTGTTGTVTITTTGGTATSAATFTVNALPVINTQPTTPADVCSGSGSRTLTVAATGATTYQWRKNGTPLTEVPPYSNVTSNTLTITNPAFFENGAILDVVVGNAAGCSLTSTSRTLTVIQIPSASVTPSPVNAATGICYAGTGAITSVSWAATATATSYDVYFGAGSLPGTVTSNVATNTYTTGTLSASTTYYWKVVAKNACGDAVGSSTWTFTTAGSPWGYCTSTGSTLGDGVKGVVFNTINNTGTPVNVAYTDYTSISTSVIKSVSYNLNVYVNTGGNYTNYQTVWIDWNGDADFVDGGESFSLGTVTNNTNGLSTLCPLSITVPAGAVTGPVRMRIQSKYNSVGTSCATGFDGETEDYILNIVPNNPCATPTAQPTALSLTPGTTSIAGTFTVSSPVADNYLVVINTTGTTPAPVNGTTYTVGATFSGNTVVDIDSNNSFTASGLSPSTTYYIFIFSYNAACTGGPLYYTTTPLNGSATTLALPYCTPTGSLDCSFSDLISNVKINTLNNTTTGCTNGGYNNYAATGIQTTSVLKGSSYNFSLSAGSGSGTHGAGVWIDFNQDSDFADVGEYFLISNSIAASSTTTISVAIPAGATAGATRMRVRYAYNRTVSSTESCTIGGTFGETEDYTITLLDSSPCVTPTAQPTVLNLTPTGTTVSGSFTPAVPAPDNYLVVINTTGTTPSPSNGTTYTIGGTVGAGNTVVDIDNNTAFTASGLSFSTTYYLFVFSYNSACSGGPLYYSTTPLTGNVTTLPANYCTPSVSAGYDSDTYFVNVSFVGTLNDVSNNSTYSSSPRGYQNFDTLPTLAKQAQGEGINISFLSTNLAYAKAWVDWNKDGDFADTGETVYDTGTTAIFSTTFGFIIPAGQTIGNYRVRLRINKQSGSTTFTSCGNIAYYGETEDYLFTVIASCSSLITAVADGVTCGPGTVTLGATGSAGVTSFKWYATETGGTALATTASGSWTTPTIATTTTYYVTAINGCESLVRTAVVANVNPLPTLNFTPAAPVVCGENSIVTLTSAGDTQQLYLINESFSSGLGVFSNIKLGTTNGATTDGYTNWQSRTSPYIGTNPNQLVWYPAISSGFGANKFVMTTSDVNPGNAINNALTLSSAVNSTNYLNLTLSLRIFYSYYAADNTNNANDYVSIEVSTDGGTTWPTELKRYLGDVGTGTRFNTETFDLSAFINQTNLKIRVRYYANKWNDGVAIDDIKLSGYVPLSTSFTWISDTPVNAYMDPACSNPYISSSTATTVYIKPTLAQLANGSFNFTATATLSNGCVASQPITVTNTSKIWQTTASTDWNDPNNWLPLGVPSSSNCVVIPNHTIISGSGYDAYAKNLTVKSTGLLDLQSNNNLTVTDWVNVDAGGVFNVKNNASLIQVNNTTNTVAGTFNMERITQPMNELDYTYWGSPLTQASGFTLGNLSPNSPLLYEWIPSISNASGNWSSTPLTTIMTPAKGYIVRAPDNSSLGTYTANFIGTPNNGNVTMPITYGTLGASTNDNWNFISNPYPSAINASTFLNLAGNVPLIGGTVYFWTHNTAPLTTEPDPFYGDYLYNYTTNDYASWNLTGGVGTAATSGGGVIPNGYIAAASGFFVKSLEVAGNATFTNAMRVSNYNNQFFKNANPTTSATNEDNLEKHRIWLNLSSSNAFSQILIGYIEGATQELDRNFDGTRLGGKGLTFYSVLPEDTLGIQGRALPFSEDDEVPLGFSASVAATCSIRIDHIDGLFDNQNIYLQDNLLNVVYDLKNAPYEFSTEVGTFNDRFILRYTDKALDTTDFNISNDIKVLVNKKVEVHSSNHQIKNIDVFDLLGRKIDSYKNIDTSQFTLKDLNKTMNVLILKITLANGVIVTQKIIY